MSNRRRSDVSPFLVMEILEEAGRLQRQGIDAFHSYATSKERIAEGIERLRGYLPRC